MDKENWERAIGQFMLAAGVIELRLLQLLWNISIPHQYDPEWAKLPLTRKVQKLKDLAKASRLSASLDKKLKHVLSKTTELMKIRNIVAHNPLSAQIAFDHRGMSPELRLQVLRNPDFAFNFDDLKNAIREAEELDQDLLDVISNDGLWNWSLNK